MKHLLVGLGFGRQKEWKDHLPTPFEDDIGRVIFQSDGFAQGTCTDYAPAFWSRYVARMRTFRIYEAESLDSLDNSALERYRSVSNTMDISQGLVIAELGYRGKVIRPEKFSTLDALTVFKKYAQPGMALLSPDKNHYYLIAQHR